LFEVGRENGYWQLSDLFDNMAGYSGAAGAPDGVVDIAPIHNAHRQFSFSIAGVLQQCG
jgi:hypothetical protein